MAYDPEAQQNEEPKSIFGVIVHSFFVVPFLIAVFCVLLFAAFRLLTYEKESVFDYLEDVKTGAQNKRWQAAFELSKILANPEMIPDDDRFISEMLAAFEHAKHDDDRVRQYLALAMARSGDRRFIEPLIAAVKDEKESNLYAVIYALGLLKDNRASPVLRPFASHADSKIRLVSMMSLGNLSDAANLAILKKGLNDSEPNVQWDAAISLAKQGDLTGKSTLINLLNREYLKKFKEVDAQEMNHIMMVVLETIKNFADAELLGAAKNLAYQDPNMKVRRAALDIVNPK